MRVALLAPPWVPVPPPRYGGTETVLDALSRGLAAVGHEVLLFASGDSTTPVERAACFPDALGIAPPGAEALELRHVIAGYAAAADYDIVHDHTLLGPLVARARGRRGVIATNHNRFSGSARAVYEACADSVGVIALSNAHARAARPIRLAGVVPHGVDLARYPVGAGEGGYALFLGRMSPDKGVHQAIDVCRVAGIPLVIAAKCRDPHELAYFDAEVLPRLGEDVRYVGEVGQEDKVALLRAARCLLNPLAWPEPFGLVMIEALACGTPVVATPAGAAPEIIEHGETGILALGGASLVTALADVGALDRAQCRRRAEQRFSATRMVEAHLALYEEALAPR